MSDCIFLSFPCILYTFVMLYLLIHCGLVAIVMCYLLCLDYGLERNRLRMWIGGALVDWITRLIGLVYIEKIYLFVGL